MVSLGIIHKRKNDLDAALDYLTQSEALFRQIGARWGIVTALTNLTDVYIIRAEIHQAKTIISKALELAVQIGSDSLTLAALEHASKLIEMKNHREDAYSIYTFILNHEASQFETRKKARDGLKRLTERDGTATTTGQEDVLISSTRATDCSFYVDRVLQILRDEKDA